MSLIFKTKSIERGTEWWKIMMAFNKSERILEKEDNWVKICMKQWSKQRDDRKESLSRQKEEMIDRPWRSEQLYVIKEQY